MKIGSDEHLFSNTPWLRMRSAVNERCHRIWKNSVVLEEKSIVYGKNQWFEDISPSFSSRQERVDVKVRSGWPAPVLPDVKNSEDLTNFSGATLNSNVMINPIIRRCGVVGRISAFHPRPGFDYRQGSNFNSLGLERGPLSLMRTTE